MLVIRNPILLQSDYCDIYTLAPITIAAFAVRLHPDIPSSPVFSTRSPTITQLLHVLRSDAYCPPVRLGRHRRLLRLHSKPKQGRRTRRRRTLKLRCCETERLGNIQRKPRRAYRSASQWFVLFALDSQLIHITQPRNPKLTDPQSLQIPLRGHPTLRLRRLRPQSPQARQRDSRRPLSRHRSRHHHCDHPEWRRE